MSDTNSTANKTLTIGLWAVQVLLAFAFGMAGFTKATAPMPQLIAQMEWPGDVPEWLVRFNGAAEMVAAIGLIVPALTKIKSVLTIWAAWALVADMSFAAIFHITRGEYPAIGLNLAFAAMAAFVAWGRSKKKVIAVK